MPHNHLLPNSTPSVSLGIISIFQSNGFDPGPVQRVLLCHGCPSAVVTPAIIVDALFWKGPRGMTPDPVHGSWNKGAFDVDKRFLVPFFAVPFGDVQARAIVPMRTLFTSLAAINQNLGPIFNAFRFLKIGKKFESEIGLRGLHYTRYRPTVVANSLRERTPTIVRGGGF
ncbi:hypothetical protein TNCT_422621 [Trichonephila clavata]|uniref:Uncharacterized protein n=1 Tax=Trichonephila clavata TaxID=2740835 RepID=A0A8X6HMR7_TRICU|nr:hypothetical protein TNCT_422621 [Trichonephila clavata]